MNKKLIGLLSLALILMIAVATLAIFSALSIRHDFTDGKIYTLSDGTKDLLKSLNEDKSLSDTVVTVKFYFSDSSAQVPQNMRDYAKKVRNLVKEYSHAANGHIVLEEYDPKPFSPERKNAKADGLKGNRSDEFDTREPWYLGMVATCGDHREAIPFFDPEMEAMLEYDLSRAIARVIWPEKPIVAVLSGISGLFGGKPEGGYNPMMQQRPTPPWMVVELLKKDYDIRELPVDAADLKVRRDSDSSETDEKKNPLVKPAAVIVFHPKNLSEKTLFALDQYVIQGGRLIACVDPLNLADSLPRQQNPQMMQFMQPTISVSNLDRLLETWGVAYDSAMLQADPQTAMQLPAADMARQCRVLANNPVFASLKEENVCKDLITTGLTRFILPCPGSFVVKAQEGLTCVPLMKVASTNSFLSPSVALTRELPLLNYQLFPGAFAREGVADVGKPPVEHLYAVRLSGMFKTAFPKGPDWVEGSTNAIPEVVASGDQGEVFLFADTDFLGDDFLGVHAYRTPDGVKTRSWNDNYRLFQNAVELCAGRRELVGIKSRRPMNRPFTEIDKRMAEADKKNEAETEVLNEELKKIREELAKEQQAFLEKKAIGGDGSITLTADDLQRLQAEYEVKQEIAEKKVEECTEKIEAIERDRYAGIERLGTKLKLINILAVPLLVILFGVLRAIIRRNRR